jgi:hypothetical protein
MYFLEDMPISIPMVAIQISLRILLDIVCKLGSQVVRQT